MWVSSRYESSGYCTHSGRRKIRSGVGIMRRVWLDLGTNLTERAGGTLHRHCSADRNEMAAALLPPRRSLPTCARRNWQQKETEKTCFRYCIDHVQRSLRVDVWWKSVCCVVCNEFVTISRILIDIYILLRSYAVALLRVLAFPLVRVGRCDISNRANRLRERSVNARRVVNLDGSRIRSSSWNSRAKWRLGCVGRRD